MLMLRILMAASNFKLLFILDLKNDRILTISFAHDSYCSEKKTSSIIKLQTFSLFFSP